MKNIFLSFAIVIVSCTNNINLKEGIYRTDQKIKYNLSGYNIPSPIIIYKNKLFLETSWANIISSDTLFRNENVTIIRVNDKTLKEVHNNTDFFNKTEVVYHLIRQIEPISFRDSIEVDNFNVLTFSYRLHHPHIEFKYYFDLDINLSSGGFEFIEYKYNKGVGDIFDEKKLYKDTLRYFGNGMDTTLFNDISTLMKLVEFPNKVNNVGVGSDYYGSIGYSYFIQDNVLLMKGLIDYEFLPDINFNHPIIPITNWLIDYYKETVLSDTIHYVKRNIGSTPKSRFEFWKKN